MRRLRHDALRRVLGLSSGRCAPFDTSRLTERSSERLDLSCVSIGYDEIYRGVKAAT